MVLTSISSCVDRMEDNLTEKTPFLQKKMKWTWFKFYRCRRFIQSKAALLILLWNFIISQVFSLIFYSNLLLSLEYSLIIVHGCVSLIFLLYPFAGYLADSRFGRYKTIITSLVVTGLGVITVVIALVLRIEAEGKNWETVGFVVQLSGMLVVCLGNVGFSANVLQYGLDQLYEFPSDDQSLFIHWYSWSTQVSSLIALVVLNASGNSSATVVSLLLMGITSISLIILVISVIVAYTKKKWFLIEPSRHYPYKIVFEVLLFSWRHKVPLNRSAFTYCEDEIPSGLDLGKRKYGGPFTTEQVEDVKAFYGILKVLLSLGPTFFLLSVSEPYIPSYEDQNKTQLIANNMSTIDTSPVQELLLTDTIMLSLVPSIVIPLYVIAIRPLVMPYIPSILKRIGVAISGVLFVATATLVIYTVAYINKIDLGHMFSILPQTYSCNSNEYISNFMIGLLVTCQVLRSLANTGFQIGLFEFMCSQSPTSMKGFLIGLSYAIRGTYNTLSLATVTVISDEISNDNFLNYKMVRQIIAVVSASVFALPLYMYFSRSYKLRQRDEPCHVHRYVEDYYSKLEQESLYDYSSEFS